MSVDHYRGMLAQHTRMEAFQKAIQAAVVPGEEVLEVGTGLGTYAMFAARAGASRVWAVEGGPILSLTRQVVQDNDLAHCIEFLQGWYPEVAPPGPVSLAIFEDYGPRLLEPRTVGILEHLAQGPLADGGRLLPAHARIRIAPVHGPENLAHIAPLGGARDRLYGFDWESSRDYGANLPMPMNLRADQLLGEPVTLCDLTLLPPPRAQDVGGEAEWRFPRDAEVHGLAYWFDLEVGEGCWLSNEPGGVPGSWGHLFLPADRPIHVPAGTAFQAEVGFDAEADGAPGWMRWRLSAGDRSWSAHEFRSFVATAADLRRTSPQRVPRLSPSGQVTRRVLELVDGRSSVEEMVDVATGEGWFDTRYQAEQFIRRTLSAHTEVEA